MAKLLSKDSLTAAYTACHIEAPEIAAAAQPGHVVLYRPAGSETATPCVITDCDTEKGVLTVVGRTQAPGDTDGAPIELTGPLGRTTAPAKPGKILCIAEALGVAALIPRLREFKERGWYTQIVAGYPSKDTTYWTKRLDELSDELYVVTEDGSLGIRGPIRHTVRAVCEQTGDIDRVLVVGPLALLKTTAEITRKHDIPTWVSLNAVFDGALEGDAGRSALEDRTSGGDVDDGASTDIAANFDWSEAGDLNAHEIDFDKLSETLGIRIRK